MTTPKSTFRNHRKLGILGAGQLGKMLAIAAADWHLPVSTLDQSDTFPAAPYCSAFRAGDFNRYEDVYAFGKTVDVLTIEIEHVNIEALFRLQAEGVEVHPRPEALAVIKDKGLQKQFWTAQALPTMPYRLYDSAEAVREALRAGVLSLPMVQKTRTDGYDGRGVAIIRTEADLGKLLEGPCVVEELADIDKELAVIVARNVSGETKAFPAVEMSFHPEANLVEFLICPAGISEVLAERAAALAIRAIEAFDICGLLAVELFLTRRGELMINEVAPRPHNSGHHTINSCYTSQFEQHLRGVMNLPLGSVAMKTPSVMMNLLGEPGYEGPVVYEGFEEALATEGTKIHLYGKAITKPYRKMGHVTILDPTLEGALEKARYVQAQLKVRS
jgi:5-(carboxyamino)imidazole ribonucleotide synthase